MSTKFQDELREAIKFAASYASQASHYDGVDEEQYKYCKEEAARYEERLEKLIERAVDKDEVMEYAVEAIKKYDAQITRERREKK